MIILDILMWIIIAILFAACIPICLQLKHENGEDFILIKWLFLKYKLYPFEEKEEKEKVADATKAEGKPKTKKKEDFKDEKIGEYINLFMAILNGVKKPIIYLLKSIRITVINFTWAISSEDAHKTALNYGQYSGSFWIFYSLISKVFTVKGKNINIYPNFLKEESSFNAYIKICFIPIIILIIALWAAVAILIALIKNKGANKNEPTSN